ncbi:MAG: DUF1697 domain-containing protein [Bryobacteraceae bacterium]|nr:DUF1697 domain-containing protein [Bryobacteraceae bacterium]
MTYVAFLRAINVGGRVVKMEALRGYFIGLGLANVRSFISSGNIVFDSAARPATLEAKIEKHLHAALGYEVETFLRTASELRAVERDVSMRLARELTAGAKVYVGFLRELPPAANQRQVTALNNAVDVFSFGARELYWLCYKSMAETTVSGPKLAKALGSATTARSIVSLRKLLATFDDVK